MKTERNEIKWGISASTALLRRKFISMICFHHDNPQSPLCMSDLLSVLYNNSSKRCSETEKILVGEGAAASGKKIIGNRK